MSVHNNSYDDNLVNKLKTEITNDDNFKEVDEQLIEAVKVYPHLYSHQDKHFKNYAMKEHSWKQISAALDISVADCKNRWVRLRERFGREKRQRELDSKSGRGTSKRCFMYYHNLLFLDEHVKRRKSYSNNSNSKRPKNPETNEKSFCTFVKLETQDPQTKNPPSIAFAVPNPSNPAESPRDLASFRQKLQQTSGKRSSAIVLDQNPLITNGSPHQLADESDSSESSTSSGQNGSCCSGRDQRRRTNLEGTLITLCRTMEKYFGNRFAEVAQSPDEIFAKLVAQQLSELPVEEKRRKQLDIMRILYAPGES